MHDNNPENNQPPNRDAGNLMLGPQQKKSRLPEMIVNIIDDDIHEGYEDMLKAYHGSFKNLTEGDVVRGRVLSVSDTQVTVDIGYKSEGIISIQEFLDETGKPCVHPGQEVDVYLEQTEDQNGYILLSREKAERMKVYAQEHVHHVNLIVYAGVQLREEVKNEVEDLWINSARKIIKLQQQIDGIKPVKRGDFDHRNIDGL